MKLQIFDVIATLLVAHLVLWSFGMPPAWGDATDDFGRWLVLIYLHVVAVGYGSMRVAGLIK